MKPLHRKYNVQKYNDYHKSKTKTIGLKKSNTEVEICDISGTHLRQKNQYKQRARGEKSWDLFMGQLRIKLVKSIQKYDKIRLKRLCRLHDGDYRIFHLVHWEDSNQSD
jgi:hypothetical protein